MKITALIWAIAFATAYGQSPLMHILETEQDCKTLFLKADEKVCLARISDGKRYDAMDSQMYKSQSADQLAAQQIEDSITTEQSAAQPGAPQVKDSVTTEQSLLRATSALLAPAWITAIATGSMAVLTLFLLINL